MPIKKLNTVSDLLDILSYGKNAAKTAKQLYELHNPEGSLDLFKRQLRYLSGEARKLGHRVIGDDNGYYLSLNDKEWGDYCSRRFAAIKDELVSLAGPQKISVKDLIKVVYAVRVDDNNYNLNL